MRTLFLNPPSYDDFDGGAGSRYQAKREVWSFWYPTWLCYPAGMLPGARVLDAPPHGVSPEETVRIARDFDLVVVHTSTPSFRADVRTAQAIKDAKPAITIGFVGGHVTAMPEESLRYAPVIDFVARKEFDLAVVAVAEGRPFADVKGISYRQNGTVVHNEEPPSLTTEQLDALPFVTEVYERDLDYLKYNSPYCQYPYVSLYTGRGCPARCTFCLWPQVTTGHTYRVRSVGNVLEEVSHMRRRFPKMKELFFDDDTFTADPPRAREIAQGLGRMGITWSTNSRANVDRETLKVLKDGGLRLFVVGYESGNEQILKNIRKGVSVERARRFTRDCHELGILIHGTFILGLPGETRDTIQETMRFAREMQPETLQVSLASPYPGTAFYDFVTRNDYLTVDSLVDETGYQKCTVSYPEVSADEIFKAVETFYRRYYFTPRYIWKSVKKMATSREEAKRLLGEGVQFIGSMAKRRRIVNTSRNRRPAHRPDAPGGRLRPRLRALRRRLPPLRVVRRLLVLPACGAHHPPAPAGRAAAPGHGAEAAQGPRHRPLRQPRELLPAGLPLVPDRVRGRGRARPRRRGGAANPARLPGSGDRALGRIDAGREPQGREPLPHDVARPARPPGGERQRHPGPAGLPARDGRGARRSGG